PECCDRCRKRAPGKGRNSERAERSAAGGWQDMSGGRTGERQSHGNEASEERRCQRRDQHHPKRALSVACFFHALNFRFLEWAATGAARFYSEVGSITTVPAP